MKFDLSQTPKYDRGDIARGLAAAGGIDPDGGANGAGLITGAAVITRGEALGHNSWIDRVMLNQVAGAINAAGMTGIKARFTHPDLSADGLGTFLGRWKNAAVDGDIVRADLHFVASAHETPDGDLAAYVMQLAADDPAAFGTSIVFLHDIEAETEFEDENSELIEWEEPDGRKRQRRVFQSPDPDNEQNFYHVRLAELRSVDTVDEPAANPSGLFRRRQSEVVAEADAVLSYALGLAESKPEQLAHFSVDADRVAGYLHRFLNRNGLTIGPQPKGTAMPLNKKQSKHNADEKPAANEPQPAGDDQPAGKKPAESGGEKPAESGGDDDSADGETSNAAGEQNARGAFQAELRRFVERFGADNGAKWFAAGKSYTEALELHADAQAEQLAAKETELAAVNEKLASIDRGETTPVESAHAAGDDGKPQSVLASAIRISGKHDGRE